MPSGPGIYSTSLQSRTQIQEPSISEIKEELRTVLASPRLRQSPRLVKLLRYLCGRVLAEEAGRITEYTIAVDVLGKSEDFKEGKDAIVRVEVHRLRKRLAEFYAEEGASHRVRILIPAGNYAPQFRLTDGAPEAPLEDQAPPVQETPAQPIVIAGAPPLRARFRRRWAAIAGMLAAAALLPPTRWRGAATGRWTCSGTRCSTARTPFCSA